MIYLFAGFELDTDTNELRRGGETVAIAPKAFSVLTYLVEHRNRLVTKAELLDAFWSANVSEAALQTTISLVRKALQGDAAQEPIIKTYHGQGFRLVSPVTSGGDAARGFAVVTPKPVQERRLIAVLCARFSMDTAPVSFEEESGFVAAFVSAAGSLIEAEQGKLIRMMMDGFTVSFGLEPHFEDGARRAAYCAWRLSEYVDEDSGGAARVRVSFGIETGSVLQENPGTGWTPPNEIERNASLLAQNTGCGEILVNDTTRVQLGDEVTTLPVENGFRLTSPPERTSGIPARPHSRPTRFVGRAAEHAFLEAAWANAQQGSGKAIILFGPAGIGKTRLASEFLSSVQSGSIQTAKVQCLPRLRNTSLAPVRRICAALFRDLPETTPEDHLDRALLRWFLDDAVRPDPILESISDQMRHHQGRDLVIRLLAIVCEAAPLVLVVEDVHWIDNESRLYLDAIARMTDAVGMLLIVTTRPDHDLALEGATLQLAPLGHDESLMLLREMPEVANLSASDADALAQRAVGNPFFLEELALAVGSGKEVHANLPETVQAVMEVRIADLEVRARTLLYVISVCGPSAAVSLIAQLAGLTEADIEPDLTRLVKQGFLAAGLDSFGFRHVLLHDTAYAMIAPQDRKRLHKRVAEFMESTSGDEQVRQETLAWHLQRADDIEQAITCWARASQAAIYRSDRQDAISFAQNGLSLLTSEMPDAVRQELSLQLSLGTALMAVEGYGSARVGTALERAHVLGRTDGSFKSQARIRAGLWVHNWVAGKLPDSISHAEALLDMARQVDDPALLLQAHAGLGAVLVHTGNLQPAIRHLRAGLEHATADNVTSITIQNSAVTCAAYASWVAGLRGNRAEMQAYCDRTFELSQMVSNPFATSISLALCSESFMFIGDVEGCHGLASEAVLRSREHDFPFWLGTGLILSGWAQGQRGQFDQALAEIDEGLAVFQATGARVQLANWCGLKAETHLAASQPVQGLEMAELALRYAAETNDIWFTPRIHAIAAELCRRLDRPKQTLHHQTQCERLVRANGLAESFVNIRGPHA